MPETKKPTQPGKLPASTSAPKKRGRPSRQRTPDLVALEALAIASYHEARNKDGLSGPAAIRRVLYRWEYGSIKALSKTELQNLLARDQPADSRGPVVLHTLVDPKDVAWHSFEILDLVTTERQRLGRMLTDREIKQLLQGLPPSAWQGVPLARDPTWTIATKLAPRPKYQKSKPQPLRFGKKRVGT